MTTRPSQDRAIKEELVKKEKQAVESARQRNVKQKHKGFPKSVVVALIIVIAVGLGLALAFNISELIKINNNREQFVQLRAVLQQIEATDTLSVSGSEWIRSERCIATPITNFELTYEARKEWICSNMLQRAVVADEDRGSTQTRLVLVVSDHFNFKKYYTSEEGAIVLETSYGMRCSVYFGLKEEYGETGGVAIGCYDGAYKPWYHKGVL